MKGIDVSHFQGHIDWPKVAQDGVEFAICKASDGGSWFDPTFRSNIQGAQAAGLLTGAYHFFRPMISPQEQAENFMNQLMHVEFPQLIVLDLEPSMNDGKDEWNHLTSQQAWATAESWLDYVQDQIGKVPFVYCSPSFANAKLQMCPFGIYPLWLAKYSTTVPQGWQNYKIWQYSESGNVPGISGNVDLDQFNGSRADLLALASPGLKV
jgi:GH25 family lysozyme M1 (1,4-beta-N-acetylmuramidase)